MFTDRFINYSNPPSVLSSEWCPFTDDAFHCACFPEYPCCNCEMGDGYPAPEDD